jgi:histidyl-tRNA synthetase
MKTKLSKLPYKGTSDTYPEEMYYRNYLFDTWKYVAQSFGYEQYDTPLIEEAQLYKEKSGEEIANNQLYSFEDKGGREIAIRPELTPSLARIVAAKRKELSFPLRWFNIGRFYRYEKPQRGRSREFFQLNIDILGVKGIEAEIEIIQFIMAVMEQLKAPKETYELKVSNRYLLNYFLEEILKVDQQLTGTIIKAIDTYPKMSAEDFDEYLVEIGLDDKQVGTLEDFLKWEVRDLENIKEKSKGAEELLELFEKANDLNITNIRFCPHIVRGLQYYTGIVVEMFDIGGDKNPRALFGGGRYDNLLEIFDEENIPAFGLGWGDVTTLNYLETYNLLPDIGSTSDVFIPLMDKSLYEEVSKTAQYLRGKEIRTEIQLNPTKLSKQLKYANRKNFPWVIIIGEDEIEQKKVVLKNMKETEQRLLTLEEAVDRIKTKQNN